MPISIDTIEPLEDAQRAIEDDIEDPFAPDDPPFRVSEITGTPEPCCYCDGVFDEAFGPSDTIINVSLGPGLGTEERHAHYGCLDDGE